MNRWHTLATGVALLALALVVLGRMPKRAAAPLEDSGPATETAVTFRLLEHGVVEPAQAVVAKDRLVRLTLVNDSTKPVAPRLSGYDDRVTIPPLAPGASWTDTFTADRPGADFALWIDDEPAARLFVQGSHLVEGHR